MDFNELCIGENCVFAKTNISQSNKFNYQSVTVQQCFDFCNDKKFDNLYDMCQEGSQLAYHYQHVSVLIVCFQDTKSVELATFV